MIRLVTLCLAVAAIVSTAYAGEITPSEPEGIYICLQNAAMIGSVWHPVECKRLADIEDQIADHTSKPVVQIDRIDPLNAVGSLNIWWKVDFKGVGKPTDETAHWFCSDHGEGFSCVWQSTRNLEDWAAYNQFRNYGMTDVPSVFWVPKELALVYRNSKPLLEVRAANEARSAKAKSLAESSNFAWVFIPYDGVSCRPLGAITPFKYMQSVSVRRHHSPVDWDAPIEDGNTSQSTVATSNDPIVAVKDGPVQIFRFFVSAKACNAMLASSLPKGGIKVSDADMEHKPAIKWLITDDFASAVACHWPNSTTGKSPAEFLDILKRQGAQILEVSKSELSTTNKRTSFEILFAYTLKEHTNQIRWTDLGDFGCDRRVKDQLQVP